MKPRNRADKLDIFHFNLFIALYKTPNTVEVAKRLGLSQSSVSRGLAKLRYIFDDQLFVRNQRGMEPTHIAIRLAEQLPEAIENLRLACDVHLEFKPENLVGEVVIIMHPVVLQLVASDVYQAIHRAAPNAIVKIENWVQDASQRLIDSDAHIGINYQIDKSTKELYSKTIFKDALCLLARKDHPLVGKKLVVEDIASYDLLTCVVPEFNQNMIMRKEVERITQTAFNTPFICPDLSSLVATMLYSDALLAGLTLYQANYKAQLAALDIEIPYKKHVDLAIYGKRQLKSSPQFLWLASIIERAVQARIAE